VKLLIKATSFSMAATPALQSVKALGNDSKAYPINLIPSRILATSLLLRSSMAETIS